MEHSKSPYSNSILGLLGSLQHCPDSSLLFPVIENLLAEQEKQAEAQKEKQLQLLNTLISHITQHYPLGQNNRKRMEWLAQLTQSTENFPAIETLLDTLENEPAASLTAPAPVAPKTEAKQAAETLGISSEISSIDYSNLASSAAPDIKPDPTGISSPENSEEIKQLKQTLEERLESTRNQCKEFEDLMRLLLSDLRDAENEGQLETIKSMLRRTINKLLNEQEIIYTNIADVTSELHRFETHCEQIHSELGRVKKLSLTDELTNLPNRRAFLNRLKNESGRVQRYGYSLSVAILDLDLFKDINDTYGHAVGDDVLRSYTENVLSTFRSYDLVARYGGEEFAVLLPHTDIHGAERALNKVLEKTRSVHFEHEDINQTFTIPTFSAGVAMYTEGEPIDSVINRADKAMYTAKKLGRNRVVVQTEN